MFLREMSNPDSGKTSNAEAPFKHSWKTLLGLLIKIIGAIFMVFGFPQACLSLTRVPVSGEAGPLNAALLAFSLTMMALGFVFWKVGSRLRVQNQTSRQTKPRNSGPARGVRWQPIALGIVLSVVVVVSVLISQTKYFSSTYTPNILRARLSSEKIETKRLGRAVKHLFDSNRFPEPTGTDPDARAQQVQRAVERYVASDHFAGLLRDAVNDTGINMCFVSGPENIFGSPTISWSCDNYRNGESVWEREAKVQKLLTAAYCSDELARIRLADIDMSFRLKDDWLNVTTINLSLSPEVCLGSD